MFLGRGTQLRDVASACSPSSRSPRWPSSLRAVLETGARCSRAAVSVLATPGSRKRRAVAIAMAKLEVIRVEVARLTTIAAGTSRTIRAADIAVRAVFGAIARVRNRALTRGSVAETRARLRDERHGFVDLTAGFRERAGGEGHTAIDSASIGNNDIARNDVAPCVCDRLRTRRTRRIRAGLGSVRRDAPGVHG